MRVRVRTLPNHVCMEFRLLVRTREGVCVLWHMTKSFVCLHEKNRVGVCVRARVGELQFKRL